MRVFTYSFALLVLFTAHRFEVTSSTAWLEAVATSHNGADCVWEEHSEQCSTNRTAMLSMLQHADNQDLAQFDACRYYKNDSARCAQHSHCVWIDDNSSGGQCSGNFQAAAGEVAMCWRPRTFMRALWDCGSQPPTADGCGGGCAVKQLNGGAMVCTIDSRQIVKRFVKRVQWWFTDAFFRRATMCTLCKWRTCCHLLGKSGCVWYGDAVPERCGLDRGHAMGILQDQISDGSGNSSACKLLSMTHHCAASDSQHDCQAQRICSWSADAVTRNKRLPLYDAFDAMAVAMADTRLGDVNVYSHSCAIADHSAAQLYFHSTAAQKRYEDTLQCPNHHDAAECLEGSDHPHYDSACSWDESSRTCAAQDLFLEHLLQHSDQRALAKYDICRFLERDDCLAQNGTCVWLTSSNADDVGDDASDGKCVSNFQAAASEVAMCWRPRTFMRALWDCSSQPPTADGCGGGCTIKQTDGFGQICTMDTSNTWMLAKLASTDDYISLAVKCALRFTKALCNMASDCAWGKSAISGKTMCIVDARVGMGLFAAQIDISAGPACDMLATNHGCMAHGDSDSCCGDDSCIWVPGGGDVIAQDQNLPLHDVVTAAAPGADSTETLRALKCIMAPDSVARLYTSHAETQQDWQHALACTSQHNRSSCLASQLPEFCGRFSNHSSHHKNHSHHDPDPHPGPAATDGWKLLFVVGAVGQVAALPCTVYYLYRRRKAKAADAEAAAAAAGGSAADDATLPTSTAAVRESNDVERGLNGTEKSEVDYADSAYTGSALN